MFLGFVFLSGTGGGDRLLDNSPRSLLLNQRNPNNPFGSRVESGIPLVCRLTLAFISISLWDAVFTFEVVLMTLVCISLSDDPDESISRFLLV